MGNKKHRENFIIVEVKGKKKIIDLKIVNAIEAAVSEEYTDGKINDFIETAVGKIHGRLGDSISRNVIRAVLNYKHKDIKGTAKRSRTTKPFNSHMPDSDNSVIQEQSQPVPRQMAGIVRRDANGNYYLEPRSDKYKDFNFNIDLDSKKAKDYLGKMVGCTTIGGQGYDIIVKVDRLISYESIAGIVKKDEDGKYYLEPLDGKYKGSRIDIIRYNKIDESVGKYGRVRVQSFNDNVYKAVLEKKVKGEEDLIPGYVLEENGQFFLQTIEPEYNGCKFLIQKDDETRARVNKLVGVKLIPNSEDHQIAIVQKTLRGQEFDTELLTMIFADLYDLGIKTMPTEKELEQMYKEFSTLPKVIDEKEIEEFLKKYPNGEDTRHDIAFMCVDPPHCKEKDDAIYSKNIAETDMTVPKEARGGFVEITAISLVGEYMLRLGKDSTTFQYIFKQCPTNTYVADMVFTMFLKVFNEGLGSLEADGPRFAMLTKIYYDKNNEKVGTEICPAVVQIRATLTYDQLDYINEYSDYLKKDDKDLKKVLEYQTNINKIFKGFNLDDSAIEELLNSAKRLRENNVVLREQREKDGTINFVTIENQYDLNERRESVTGKRSDNDTEAHKIVETPMISTNIATGEYILENELPGVFRVEPGMDDEKTATKLEAFITYLNEKFHIGTSNDYVVRGLSRGEFNQTINSIVQEASEKFGKKFAHVVSTKFICSIPPAYYSTDSSIGHYALSLPCYTHSTSPDRRCPDTVNQMQLLYNWQTGNIYFTEEELSEFCELASDYSYTADVAGRQVDDLLNVEYFEEQMKSGKLPSELEGCISRVDKHELEVITDSGKVVVRLCPNECNSPYLIDQNCFRVFLPDKHKGGNPVQEFGIGDSITVSPVDFSLKDRQVHAILSGMPTFVKEEDDDIME